MTLTYKQILMRIIIIIYPYSSPGPAKNIHTIIAGRLRKSTVIIIDQQLAAFQWCIGIRHKNIQITIVIEVTHRSRHWILSTQLNSGFDRNISKRSIAVVVVQTVFVNPIVDDE